VVEQTVLAIDIGGTKMAAAVVSSDGTVVSSSQRTTPRTMDAEALFAALLAACEDVLTDAAATMSDPTYEQGGVTSPAGPPPALAAIDAVGVGCGGPMRYPDGRVSPLNIPGWRDFPLLDRLQARFSVPAVVDNDAKALALGERWLGAGRGSDNMLGMVVSTGVGGGVILDGRLLHGAAGNAGHVGHIVVWPRGPLCGCGARGCVEATSSGTGLTRRLDAALGEGAQSRLQRGASAREIADAARLGDALAHELMRSAGECVGRGIASAAALLDLELVVIGGSIALNAWDLIGPPLQAEMAASARLDFTRNLKVVHAALGDSAGLVGAARLALDHLARP
jgi:glucokinase